MAHGAYISTVMLIAVRVAEEDSKVTKLLERHLQALLEVAVLYVLAHHFVLPVSV